MLYFTHVIERSWPFRRMGRMILLFYLSWVMCSVGDMPGKGGSRSSDVNICSVD